MKTQIKRFSKSALAVVLTLCMLVSCMTVGIIATDAAKVSDSGAIAAKVDDETAGAAKEITLYAWIIKNLYDYYSGGINVWGGTSEGVKSTTKVGTTTTVSGTTYYLVKATVYNDNNMVNFKGNDNWWVNSAGTSIDLSTNNCIRINGDGADSTITALQYAATPTSADATISGVSGNGTQSNPYKLTVGTTYTVNISGVQSDSNMTGFLYNTANNATGRNTTSTRTLSSNTVSTGNSSTYYVWSYKGTTSTVSSESKSKTIYYDWVSSTTPLAKPNPSWDNATVTASPTGKATLSWAAVSNASSYKIFKGTSTTAEATVNTTSYQVDKKYSKRGDYYVVAVPSNTTSYSESEKSNKATLTVNRTKLTAPTVTVSKTDIKNGDSVTLTATDQNSGASTDQYSLYYYITTLNAIDTFKLTSGTAKTLSPTTNTTYKVVAYPVSGTSNEYYTQSDATSATQIKVYSPEYKIAGEEGLIGSTAWSYAAAKDFTDYTSNGIFTFTTQAVSAGDHYFKLYDSSHGYSGSGTQNSNTNVTIGDSNKYSITLNDSEASFKVSGSGIFVIYYDSVNKKIWVTQNTWAVSTVARVKTYNLSTGAYNAVANATSTHGTASPASINVEKGQSTTLTATAKTGYSFVGWYTNEACTTTASGSYTSTSYSATPTANTTYYALFKQTEPQKVDISVANITGATITAKWNNQTKTNGESLTGVPVGAQVSVTVTTADNKYLDSTTPALTNGKFTVTASTTSITATLGDKLKVTCTTNNTSWGTISATPEYARPGDTVTLTTLLSSGTLKKLTVYNASTSEKIKEWTRDATSGDMTVTTPQAIQSSANQMTQVEIKGIAGSIFSMINKAGEAIGAAETSVALGADADLTFRMINGAVTVSAEYEEYVGTSTWLYNGYDTSGNAKSGYYQQPMAEGSIGGSKYAYYNVTGRGSENYDQLFTVSDTSAATTGYVYFTRPNDWGTWSASNEPYAYFWNSSGQVGNNWPGSKMTWQYNDGAKGVYKIAIPSGATKVKFNDNSSTCYRTVEIDLTTTNGCYYLSGGGSGTDADGYHVSEWETPASDAGISTGVEYYKNSSGINFSDHWYTGGFGYYNANSHQFARPSGTANSKDLSTCKDDYYIVVLYPNTSYTFNNNTESTGSDPVVLWMSTLPGQTETVSSTVKVYAKDGTIRRDNDQPERNDKTYSTFEQHANTFVYSDSGYATHIGTRSSHDGQSSEGSGYNGYTYDYIAKFNKGDTLYIKTNLDSTLKEKYYLAAYCINGKTYELHTPEESATGSVTEAFTVPEDWEDKYVEITPIYFLKDTAGTKMITFYIEGYDEEVMNAGWGNTPFVYPFYQDANFNYVSNINNAFGGYPGQPMVFYKGNYYIQLPDKITTTISTGQTGTATIKGVTLGNGYWDDIHLITGEVSSHFQTYDYDDLYKIYNEKSNADHIICAFKYRTKKNNDEPASMSSATAANYNKTNGNGWEVLTNYYGQPVDVFGNVLTEGSAEYNLAMSIINGSESADSAAVVHAISQDYKSNSAGDYATEWVIYDTEGEKVTSGNKTSIVPSALAINANTSGTGELTDNFDKYDNATKAFKSIYTALYNDTNVRNKPAVVTYEKSIYGGGDKADRCDARWYFSQKNAPITATTRIEYTDDGKTWTTDEYDANTGTGHNTRTKAYFTGKASTATDTPSVTTGIDDTNTTTYNGNVGQGYYTIKAENAGQYEFVGWYLLRDNYQNISTRSSYAADATNFPSHAEMSKNGDIFVARFKKTATGTFDIYHEIHPQTTGYGTVTVSAIVKDSNGDPISGASYPASGTTNHVTIPNTYIRSGEGYKVVATFTAAPYHTSSFDAFYATVQDLLEGYKEYDFIDTIEINANANGGTATVTYNVDKMFSMASGQLVQTVTNVTHYSKFSLKDNLTYSLQYTFKTRYYGNKLYKYNNVEFTEQELRSYFLDQITDPNCDHIKLDKQFVKAKAPFESNFREDLTWVVDNVTFNNVNDPTIGYLTATQVETKWATAMVYDFDNNGDMCTTTMVAPIEKLFNASTNTKPTTYQSTEDEATAISEWSVTNDQMYHPYRTSYTHDGTTTPLYIDHWDIYQLDSFTYKTVNNNPKMMDDGYNLDVDLSKSVLVAKAYSSRFNYVGYEDYVVVPVYNTVNVDRQGLSDSRKDSSATLLTLTRNQWNANAEGNTDDSSYRDGADRVYVDFMLNYNYSVEIDGKKTNILLNSTGNNIKVGFIVRSYTWENEQKQYSKAQYVLVDKDQINDKNRMEYCFGFNNSENNRKAGLYYEFKPFIVDTSNQAGSAGCNVTIDGSNYKALYEDSTVSVLDHVSFYQLGRL